MTAIRAVFFDAVGTLLHPQPPAVVVYEQMGRRFGSQFDAETIAQRFRQAFARQEKLDRVASWRTDEAREFRRWQTIVGEVLADVTEPEACFNALYQHFGDAKHWRCEAGAGELFSALRQRSCQIGLASNYDRRLHSVLAGFPVLAAINHVVISSEVGWRKPSGEFFAALCKAVGSAPETILHVGDDSVNDYQGALAAGSRAVLFDPAGQAPSECDAIHHLSEVRRFLE